MKKSLVILVQLMTFFMIGSCSKEKLAWKSLNFYNDTENKIYVYRLEGLGVYPKGKGPQNFGMGIKHPNLLSSYNTHGNIHLNFPIEIEWGYDVWNYDDIKKGFAAPKGKVQKFFAIEGIKGNLIEQEGALLLIFGQDEKWHLKFVSGDSYVHESDVQLILKRG